MLSPLGYGGWEGDPHDISRAQQHFRFLVAQTTGCPWPKLVQTESALLDCLLWIRDSLDRLVSLSLESQLTGTFVDDTSRFLANEANVLLNNNSYCRKSKRRKHSRNKQLWCQSQVHKTRDVKEDVPFLVIGKLCVLS
jgi:hypothetical protein